MFTGLIREVGRILSFQREFLKIESRLTPKIGDSIAVNGACLTAVEVGNGWFKVELSAETRRRIAIENFKMGARVHLEPALKMGETLDGHLVQGHIDGIGVVREIAPAREGGYRLTIEPPKNLLPLLPPKGSVAVDGVSLTIATVGEREFEVAVIPLTFKTTLIGEYRPGRRVNIETDLLARYIAHYLERRGEFSSRGRGSPQLERRGVEEIGALYWW
ncbi:MAG: riboflavin synthase [Campylobacterales bacterium]